MFKKITLVSSLLIVAISASACGALPSSASIPVPFSGQQVTVSPATAPSTQPDQSTQSTQSAPSTSGTAPQVGGKAKGNKPGKGEAAIIALLERAGWDGGLVTKISADQLTVRIIERPGALNNQNQNQPGNNQPSQNQTGQNRKDMGRVDTVSVNSSTIIVVPGKTNATLNDLHTGDRVIVDVPDGQKYAALIISTPKELDKDNVTMGQITGNANGTLTLRSPGGGDTLNTTSTTQVFKLSKDGVTTGALSDLQNGNLVFAMGSGTDDKFNAQVIFALSQGVLNLGKGGAGGGKKNSQPQTPNQGG